MPKADVQASEQICPTGGACTGSEMGMGIMGNGEDSDMDMMRGMMKQRLNHNRMIMK